MCGISGIVQNGGFGGVPFEQAITKMNDRLVHRGPDDGGIYYDASAGVALGNRRLSIIDLSDAGHQPQTNEDGTIWVIQNGEIYNFGDLRTTLKKAGHQFISNTDTEVLVHGYEEWGIRGLADKLRGMFAFAIWDGNKEKIFLARDRFGIKPIYYYRKDERLLFASEVQALVNSELFVPELNRSAIFSFLMTGSVPTPTTIYKNVFSIQPSEFIEFSKDGFFLHSYWELQAPDLWALSELEAVDKIRDLLSESVHLHMISDVPVGIFLSGGIDSSALVALASHESASRLITLSVIFNEQNYNEAAYSRVVADKYHTDHVEYLVRSDDLIKNLDQIFGTMDQPTIDGVNTFFISRAAREAGLKVVLSGLGGDEVFWGYPYVKMADRLRPYLFLWNKIPRPIQRPMVDFAQAGASLLREDRWKRIEYLKLAGGEGIYWFFRGLYSPNEVENLMGQSDFALYEEESLAALQSGSRYLRGPDDFSAMDCKYYLHNQLLRDTDVMSMAHSIEARVPFLDHKLAEFVYGLPAKWKLGKRVQKRLLVAALNGLLPDEIVRRPKKGFAFPFPLWMEEHSAEVMALMGEALIPRRAVERIWKDFRAGKTHWSRVWALVVINAWLQKHG